MNPATSTDAAALWQAFCDNIKAAGMEILDSAEGLDETNQAEGLRYLTRLLKGSFEKYVEFADPLDPFIFKMCDERSGYGGDNPDNIYSASPIQAGEVYEITGNRGDIFQFNFNLFRFGTDSQYELLGQLHDNDLEYDGEGNFTIILGGEPRDKNWLPTPPGANQIMLRQTFCDRSREREVTLKIRLVSQTAKVPPLELDAMIAKLAGAESFFCRTGRLMHGWSQDFTQWMNTLPLTDPQFIAAGGGDPTAFFYISSWRIEPGQALLVHIPEFPEGKLWNLALFNFWFESLDYVNFRIHTNNRICKLNDDGSCTLVIANEDPGVDNWLNATGHIQGNMIMRAWTGGVRPVDPMTEVVDLATVEWRQKLTRWQ
ncbi:MAG: DUF1214 domain-containing protein [Porticoccaceae bacterium]